MLLLLEVLPKLPQSLRICCFIHGLPRLHHLHQELRVMDGLPLIICPEALQPELRQGCAVCACSVVAWAME